MLLSDDSVVKVATLTAQVLLALITLLSSLWNGRKAKQINKKQDKLMRTGDSLTVTTDQIHTLANGNLAAARESLERTTLELTAANARIAQLTAQK